MMKTKLLWVGNWFWEFLANVVCGFEFVMSRLYEAGQGAKAKLWKNEEKYCFECDLFALVWNASWALLDQYDKVYVETIILVLRSCKSVGARWSYGGLYEDFWLSSKKYQNVVTCVSHCKKILQFVHVAGLLGGLVDCLGQKSFGMYLLYLVLEKQFCYFCWLGKKASGICSSHPEAHGPIFLCV